METSQHTCRSFNTTNRTSGTANVNKSLIKSKMATNQELMSMMEGFSEVMMDKLMSKFEKIKDNKDNQDKV